MPGTIATSDDWRRAADYWRLEAIVFAAIDPEYSAACYAKADQCEAKMRKLLAILEGDHAQAHRQV